MRESIYKEIEVSGKSIRVPSENDILVWLKPYGVRPSGDQIIRIQIYIAMLLFWNERINLTAINDLQEIVCRHFGESLLFVAHVPANPSRLADVGSGAGFPGLALAAQIESFQVFLIEQDTRKTAFLNEVARRLELTNIRVLRSDYHAVPPEIGEFDVITARALGNYKTLLKWAVPRLASGGQVALWLGAEDINKISSLKGWNWNPAIPIPNSKKSAILTGSPII
jgi:16S rRNA (guanine527-N7)-methyltransferase